MRYRPFIISRNLAREDADVPASKERLPAKDVEPPPLEAEATDRPGRRTEAAPESAALAFGEAEVARLMAGAAAEGREAGLREAAAALAGRENEVAAALASSLQRLEAEASQRTAAARAQLKQVLRGAVQALAGGLAAERVAAAAEGLVNHCLTHLPKGAPLSIDVSPGDVEEVGRRLQGFAAPIEVCPDPALAPGRLRARWREGQAEHRPDLLEAVVLEALQELEDDVCMETVNEQ